MIALSPGGFLLSSPSMESVGSFYAEKDLIKFSIFSTAVFIIAGQAGLCNGQTHYFKNVKTVEL